MMAVRIDLWTRSVGAAIGVRRIAARPQTMALIAHDGGGTFPHCDHPPQWCQRLHNQAWIDGGLTDLDNLTLPCGYCHRNFDQRGWTPPRWIDPAQTPILHQRLTQRHRDQRTAA